MSFVTNQSRPQPGLHSNGGGGGGGGEGLVSKHPNMHCVVKGAENFIYV